MSGAERNARKRKQAQQAAQAQAGHAAATDDDRTKKITFGVVTAIVIGAAITIAAIFVLANGGENGAAAEGDRGEGEIPALAVDTGVPAERDGTVVVRGDDNAPTTIDVYADFLCPACKGFEEAFAEEIDSYVADGQLRVRTHLVPMLSDRSNPEGYSLHSANAALCAADEGAFTAYHDSLFAAQPDFNNAYEVTDLVNLGRDLGLGDSFAACVNEGTYEQDLLDEFSEIREDESVHQEFDDGHSGFSTPTVVHDGEVVDISDERHWNEDWLAELIEQDQGA
ncbi:thioredoxin domain-containing protein [Haloechinothrix sp. LS1_15]|uniref:DsbA family protein n=1 Tax=Haloechinothrix sp. LS1_15 TaxID=2652248 RepID=UPI002946C5AE|nr:thioredoxin domain-containing protein [Haloechinothrix sp. LS1_15]MDV6013775.1 thioredoxin domain-containing protein [Haloechinothrix sp. LS1_15]